MGNLISSPASLRHTSIGSECFDLPVASAAADTVDRAATAGPARVDELYQEHNKTTD
jgi:hypothetical protein